MTGEEFITALRGVDSSTVANAVEALCEEAGPSPERGCHMGDVVATMLARRAFGDAESAYSR